MCTVLSEVTERTVVVTLSTVPRTAQGLLVLYMCGKELLYYKHSTLFFAAPGDFTPILSELMFQPAMTESCVNISISRDVVLEDNEVFRVQLSTSDEALLLSVSSANVTIVDNDSKE